MSAHGSYLGGPSGQNAYGMHNMPMQQPQHYHNDQSHHNEFYASSHASASSSSSLADQLSDHEASYSNSFQSGFEPHQSNIGTIRSARSGPGPVSTSQGYLCPNCGKTFARDDLLRRHLAREARAQAQPSFDRQKSCYECAKSKARCDLEVPTCGRCRARGKQCTYAPRSGNPNVRKARNLSGMGAGGTPLPSNMIPSSMPADANFGSSMPQQTWGIPAPDYDMTGPSFMAPHPGYVKKEGEAEYDSQSDSDVHSWHDASAQQYQVTRSSPGSSTSSSVFGSPRSQHGRTDLPDSAPPNMSAFTISSATAYAPSIAEPIRTASPHSYHDLHLHVDASPGPQAMPSRKSSGFSRTNTGSIVTNINRRTSTYANEDGEETPIVRKLGHSESDTMRLQSNTNPNYLAAPQSRHRTASLPEVHEAMAPDATLSESVQSRSSLASSFIEQQEQQQQQQKEQQQRQQQTQGNLDSMLPPPRPPTLITANLGTRFAWPAPSPVRSAIFRNGVDLSGWLGEPVVPSPLYRMGPSMHSSLGGAFSGMIQSPIIDTPISAKFAASLAQSLGLSANAPLDTSFLSNMQLATPTSAEPTSTFGTDNAFASPSEPSGSRYDCDGQLILPAPQLPSARQWWMQPDQKGEVAASIAQASAAHFVSYPALLVLTDPTAPIPPFIHRKWLKESRATIPALLANARSVLAGYVVRLPSSQALVWSMIADQIKQTLAMQQELCKPDSDRVEVFAAVASLWMYLVLVIFTDEPCCMQHINAELLDAALLALSELSKTLLQRTLKAFELDPSLLSRNHASFGWTETMIRTVFASYALLVLQRFRENAGNIRQVLADCTLVLDLPIPSGAAEFEANTEEEWRAAQSSSQAELSKAGMPFTRPTLRQLVQFRKDVRAQSVGAEAADAKRKNMTWTTSLFDSHDEFAKVVLSVAFALDDTRI